MANFWHRAKFTNKGQDWSLDDWGEPNDFDISWHEVLIAQVSTPPSFEPVPEREEAEANAQLIVNAPKLFWKLADVLLALENGGLRKPKQWEASIRETLEAAIAPVPRD